jgi:hypothetical protein
MLPFTDGRREGPIGNIYVPGIASVLRCGGRVSGHAVCCPEPLSESFMDGRAWPRIWRVPQRLCATRNRFRPRCPCAHRVGVPSLRPSFAANEQAGFEIFLWPCGVRLQSNHGTPIARSRRDACSYRRTATTDDPNPEHADAKQHRRPPLIRRRKSSIGCREDGAPCS